MMDRTDLSRRTVWMSWFFRIYWILAIASTECESLKNVKLDMNPDIVERGGQVTLKCEYDLEGAPLYALKWYRGEHEFYQYSPKEKPSIRTFNHSWINVDLSNSNDTVVTFKNVDFHLSGNFSCEITTDTTDFLTASNTRTLTVVVLPHSDPVIKTEQPKYEHPGQILNANCTTTSSKPSLKLSFTINNLPVPESAVKQIKNDGELEKIGLSLKLSESYFDQSRLTLRCVAYIPEIYSRASQVELGSRVKDPIPARVMSNSSSTVGANRRIENFLIISSAFATLLPMFWR